MKQTRFKLLFQFSILALSCMLISSCGLSPQNNQPVKSNSEQKITTGNTIPVLFVSIESQKKAGIHSQIIQQARLSNKILASGSVIALPDVSDLKSRYVIAYSDLNRAKATQNATNAALIKLKSIEKVTQQELGRLKILNADNKNISDKVLETAQGNYESSHADVGAMQSTLQLDMANVNAAKLSLKAIQEAATQRLGPVVSDWVMTSSPQFYKLINRKATLIQITLPSDTSILKMPKVLVVKTPGGMEVTTHYVSTALQTDVKTQGFSNYYLASTEGNDLIPGATITAEIPSEPARNSNTRSTLFIPSSAIVWWSGKPWVYIAKDATHFYRHELSDYVSEQNRWYVKSGLEANTTIVTQGAELLLSEEFQSQFAETQD